MASGCEDDELAAVLSELVCPDMLEFGDVPVGTTESRTLTCVNIGDAALVIKSIEIENGKEAFATENKSAVVPPQGEVSIRVRYAPPFPVPHLGELAVRGDAASPTEFLVSLRGTGVSVDAIDAGVTFIDGGVQHIDGGVFDIDGGVVHTDGGSAFVDGGVRHLDGGVIAIDGGVRRVDGGVAYIDGGVKVIDGGVRFIDGGFTYIDGGVLTIDGGVQPIDGGARDAGLVDTGVTPACGTWLGPTPGAWVPRSVHSAVWTGTEAIAWGGWTAVGVGTTSGGRLRPTLGMRSRTSTLGAPAPRIGHTAVWTGDEMIVWGGYTGGAGLVQDTGARYHPLADRWTPTSSVGAPSGRGDHTAIWTGTEMIIWGGSALRGIYRATGARYDPMRDAWTPTSMVGAPSQRASHVAVWTGTRMFVWGGIEYGGEPARFPLDGAMYDPVADAWSPISTIGAPSPRSNSRAVWTGIEVLVWGGADRPNAVNRFLSTGGHYDPQSDVWRSTSTVGAPSGRVSHSSVWTADVMVVWGGTAGGTPISGFNTGGCYDPTTREWAPTSMVGAPSERWFHTATWTGIEMVVWGGWETGYSISAPPVRFVP